MPARPLRRSPAPRSAVARPDLFASHPVAAAVSALRRTACRYPIGDPLLFTPSEPFRFCAQPVRAGTSYCGAHHDRCVSRVLRPLVRASAGALP